MQFMKRLISLLLTLVVALVASAQEPQGLPVMHISFEGNIIGAADYLPGRMVLTDVDGSRVELSAKFRTRGATARQYTMKPALNLKLRTEDYAESVDFPLLGLRECSSWILDAMAIDPLCLRNRVSFDVWNEFSRLPYETDFDGRNGTVGRYIELWMNGTYYGVYCLSDKINRKLLDLKKVKEEEGGGFEVRGVLYKHGTQDIGVQNERCFNEDYSACVVGWHNAWELSEPDDFPCEEAWGPLLDAYDNGQSMAYVKKYFFMENLADYQIFIMAFGIMDNWGNKNRFFSIRNIHKDIDAPDADDADRRRITVTPWDLDAAFGGYEGKYSEFTPEMVMKNGVYPFSLCMGDSEYKAHLRRAWERGRTGALSVDNVKRHLYEYRDLLLGTGAWRRMTDAYDARKDKPCHVHDLAAEVENAVAWYKRSFAALDAYFGIVDGIDRIEADAPAAKGKVVKDGRVLIHDAAGRTYTSEGKRAE